ncbi:MAG: TraC family protein [Rhizobiaceae bacterium]|nr:TraC family protein [Rhizobiaceae bacterium]
MKKPSSRIREEIAKLQEQLKQAETREAERIGRVALKAGLGDLEIEESALQTAFEEIAATFRKGGGRAKGAPTRPVEAGAASGQAGEA